MTSPPLFPTCLTLFLAYLLLAGNCLAQGDYDEETYGPEDTITWDKPIKATFDHKPHTMDMGLECADCHDDLFSMEAGAAVDSGDFTMKAMAGGQFCGSCHDGSTAFATDTNCTACHTLPEDPIIWREPTKAAFSHTAHVEEFELECVSCHNEVFTMEKGAAAANEDFTMLAFKEGKYCGSCHNGDEAFDSATQCESCHFPPTEKIIFTQPVKSVVFDHNIHVKKAELSCESCHKEVFTMKKGTVEGEELFTSDNPMEKREHLVNLHKRYCGTCHDSSQAFGYLTRCTVCHIGIKGLRELTGEDQKKDAH
jgi:c(7)-type cytochrome triheme protein